MAWLEFGSTQPRQQTYGYSGAVSNDPNNFDPGGLISGLPNRIAATISPNAPEGIMGKLGTFLRPNNVLMADAHSQAMQAFTQASKLSMPFQYGMVSAIQGDNLDQAQDNLREAVKPFMDAGLKDAADLVYKTYENAVQAHATQMARNVPAGAPDAAAQTNRFAPDFKSAQMGPQLQAENTQRAAETAGLVGTEARLHEQAPGVLAQQEATRNLTEQQAGLAGANIRAVPGEMAARAAGANLAGAQTTGLQTQTDFERTHGYKMPTGPAQLGKPQSFTNQYGDEVLKYPNDDSLYIAPTRYTAGIPSGNTPERIQELMNAGVAESDPTGRLRMRSPAGGAAPPAAATEPPAATEPQPAPPQDFLKTRVAPQSLSPEDNTLIEQSKKEIADIRAHFSGDEKGKRIAAIVAKLRAQLTHAASQ